jgi:hypothetical protein
MFTIICIGFAAVIVLLMVMGFGLTFSQSDGAHDMGMQLIFVALCIVVVWFGVIIWHFLRL